MAEVLLTAPLVMIVLVMAAVGLHLARERR